MLIFDILTPLAGVGGDAVGRIHIHLPHKGLPQDGSGRTSSQSIGDFSSAIHSQHITVRWTLRLALLAEGCQE